MCGEVYVNYEEQDTKDEVKRNTYENRGSLRAVYIDTSGGTPLAEERVYRDLPLGNYIYTTMIIDGYDLIGNSMREVELKAEEPHKTLIFTYEKIKVAGRVAIKYIDMENNQYLLPEEKHKNLTMGNYQYEAPRIKGYNLLGDKVQQAHLTEEEPRKVIIFTYEKTE